MASSNKTSVFRNLALVLALLLVASMAESRTIAGAGGLVTSPPTCDSVYGAQEGDTCSDVAQTFHLSTDLFLAINPNINCDDIFVGQWLCVAGSA